MVWFNSILAGILTAIAAMFAAGGVAILAVDWYRIPSREGGSGYFVIAMAILGLIAGFVIGCICAGVNGPTSYPSFFRTIGISFSIVVTLAGTATLLSRLLADIPPTLDGEKLFLIVEFRLPATQLASPSTEIGDANILLGSIPYGSRTVRKSEQGPLFLDDATHVDGRWIVRGAIEIFTRRGKRLLAFHLGSRYSQGFVLPLPGNPGTQYLQWSEWLPRIPAGVTLPTDPVEYRFRVQRKSTPMKTEVVGPFEIDTITDQFYYDPINDQPSFSSRDTFAVRCHGQNVKCIGADDSALNRVVTFPTNRPAMIVNATMAASGRAFFLLTEVGEQLHQELISTDIGNETVTMLPSIPKPTPVSYRCAARMLIPTGIYRLGTSGIFDTRTLAIRSFTPLEKSDDIDSKWMLALSPDERSFARCVCLDNTRSNSVNAVEVSDFIANRSYALPIKPTRMHFQRVSELTPEWLEHHFMWAPNAKGVDELIERPDFKPLPYRGEFTRRTELNVYHLNCAGDEMRKVMEEYLIREFKAQRVSTDPDYYNQTFSIDGHKISVSGTTDNYFAMLSMPKELDVSVAIKIAEGFDAVLATGQYDSLFLPQKK